MEKATVKDLFEQFDLLPPTDMAPCQMLYGIFKGLFLDRSVQAGLVYLLDLSLAGDGTPVYTAARERKKRTCDCLEKGFRDCQCDRFIASLTVTSDGIPTGNVTISAMICI